MCQRKPGPRCSKHAGESLEKAVAKHRDAQREYVRTTYALQQLHNQADNEGRALLDAEEKERKKLLSRQKAAETKMHDAQDKVYVAERNYKSSPDTIKRYENQCADLEMAFDALEHDEGVYTHEQIQEMDAEYNEAKASLNWATQQRNFERDALKHELKREKRIAQMEECVENGDQETLRRLMKEHGADTDYHLDIQKIVTARPVYEESGTRMIGTYRVELPQGGTAVIKAKKTIGDDRFGRTAMLYTVKTTITAEKADAPGNTRKGFGNYRKDAGTVTLKWEGPPASKEGLRARMGNKQELDMAAEFALRAEVKEHENAYQQDILARFLRKH